MIVDASVAFKWIALEQDSELANKLLTQAEILAPTLLLIEVGNGLWKKALREQVDRSVSFSSEIKNLAQMVTLVDETDHVLRALDMARELDHPLYDCVYLAMAESLGDRLVSVDTRFAAKLAGSPYARLVMTLSEAVTP